MEINPVPWLRSGVGNDPQDGGCIMQVIDWISSGGWSDYPKCVHPDLRAVAIHANDAMDDKGRQKLLALAPRLMNTSRTSDLFELRSAGIRFIFGEKYHSSYPKQSTFTAQYAYLEEHYLALLNEMLDAYDEEFGRDSSTFKAPDWSPVCAVMAPA